MLSKIKIIYIIILLTLPFLNGCLEEKNTPTHKTNIIYVDDSGKADYKSIQKAIDSIPNNQTNYTIYVHSGIYRENIIINKTINLIGENPETTIINGTNFGNVIYINRNGRANIKNFTIEKSGRGGYPGSADYNAGIKIESGGNNISNNIIIDNRCGIYTVSAPLNNFSYNIIKNNEEYGMYIYVASDRAQIYHNVFIDNKCGLRIKSCKHCVVSMNVFMNNEKGMYFCCGAKYNTAFHNTFINNSLWNADDLVGENQWDNGLEGNYWSDYNGTDNNGDGIGDTPYNLTSKGNDRYPLMQPIITYKMKS